MKQQQVLPAFVTANTRRYPVRCDVFLRVCLLTATVCLADLVQSQVVIDDPIAYWNYEDAAGVLSNQVISSPYHDAGVLAGQPAAGIVAGGSGIVGSALVLDGASALWLPYHQDNLGRSFTIALWYWQENTATRQCLYQTKDTWNISYEALNNNSTFASYVGEADAGRVTTEISKWIHLVHSFATVGSTTTLSVYTNGALVLTKAVSAANVFEIRQIRRIHLGSSRYETGGERRFFRGMIDELALYDRALSAAEAAALYQRGLAGEPLEVTPQAWPRIDLAGTSRSFLLSADDGVAPGVYQDGWLLAGHADEPPIIARIEDTAAHQVKDTAGHQDGPFHAVGDASPKFRVPLTAGGLGQVTEGDFTIEARFRTTEKDRGIIMGNYIHPSLGYLNLEVMSDTNVRIVINKGVASDYIILDKSAGKKVRDGAWHHIAGIRSNDTIYLYLDGVEIGQTPDTVGAGSFTLGSDFYYFKGDSRVDETTFDGDIENARMWTRALSVPEVENLVTNAMPGAGMVSTNSMLAEYTYLYAPSPAVYADPKYKITMVPPLAQMTLDDWTVETWFRSTDTKRAILLGNYFNASSRGINLELTDAGNNRVRMYLQNTVSQKNDLYGAAGTSRDGAWHHVAGLRRGNQLYLYYDGQQVANATDNTGSSYWDDNGLYLGRDCRTSTLCFFNGDLRNARLWSRALETTEVTALAAGDLPGEDTVAFDDVLAEYASIIQLTNSLNTAGIPGSWILRTQIKGTNCLSLVFENLPRHTKVGLGMLLAQLDSLSNISSPDLFAVKIDGTEVLSLSLGCNDGVETLVSDVRLFGEPADAQVILDTMTFGGENLYYCGSSLEVFNEHVYDLSLVEPLQRIPHKGGTLLLELIGSQDDEGGFESFGVDNIKLTIPPAVGTIIILQ